MTGRMMSNGITAWAVLSWSGKRHKHQDLNCLFSTDRHVIQAWAMQMWVDS